MARKPNYSYEKNARARAKAAKREAKRQAKLANKAARRDGEAMPEDASDDETALDAPQEDSPAPDPSRAD